MKIVVGMQVCIVVLVIQAFANVYKRLVMAELIQTARMIVLVPLKTPVFTTKKGNIALRAIVIVERERMRDSRTTNVFLLNLVTWTTTILTKITICVSIVMIKVRGISKKQQSIPRISKHQVERIFSKFLRAMTLTFHVVTLVFQKTALN